MTAIVWDASGQRFFETGVDKGVLFPMKTDGTYDAGVPWNGLIGVSENPSGAEPNPQYADNIKYLNLLSTEEFAATLEAFTYPDEFAPCDGSVEPTDGVVLGQQGRTKFALAYRTRVGNDVSDELAYKIHLIYGCLAAPSQKDFQTVGDSPDAVNFSWEVSTTPVEVTGQKPTSNIIIDSRSADATKLAAFEVILYGKDDPDTAPRIPLPDEVVTLMTPG